MCCTTLLTRGVQHALDLSGCNIQKPHLIVVKFILRRGRTNVHIEIQEFDGGVRATGLLCLLGVGIGLGTFLVYKLYTRLYFKFSSAVDRNFVSSINNQQTGKTLNAETPDSGISSDTQQQQQQQEQQRQQQSENDDASSVNVPSQWRKRIIDWLAKSSFSLEDGDVDEKDNESCDGNVDGKLNRFQLRNKGSKLLDPMLTSFASGWSSGFISNGDNNCQETNNNYVSDDNDDQCLNEGCHDNDDGMMDGINEESEDNEDAVDRDAKHHHHHHQQHHHPHHQYSPISDGDHHQQKHHRHSTGSQGAQHHHHVRKHSVGNIQMLSRRQRPHSGRTTSSSRSSDQGGDGWAGNGSRVLRRNCYSFASHKSGDSSLYDYRESLISKGYSIDLGENLDDVVLPDEQAFMSSERLNALDENENDERSDVNGLSKRGAVDHMDRLQYELMKIRMDIDCMNEKFDHLYQGREEQFITFNISNCSPHHLPHHHLPPLHLQDYPPQHITTTDIVPNYSDPVYNYITDDNKFTDTNDCNNFDDVCDDVSDDEADDDDNNADVDKDFETFDFIWDYHSDLAAINSPGFISNRPLINDNNNRNNNHINNHINSYNNSFNNSNEFNSTLTNMSARDTDATKTSETTLYHDGNQHYGDFSFNDHYNDTTNNNNNNDDDDDDNDDIFAGKHGGYNIDPEKCSSGKKVLKKMDSSNSDGSCAPPSRTRKESLVLFYMDDDINDNFIIDEDEFFVSPSLFNIKNVANKRSSMHLSFNNQYFPSSHSTPRKSSKKKMAKSTTQLTPKHLNATTQLESDFKKCIARLLQPSTTASKSSAKSTSNNSPRRLKNLQNDKNAEKIKNNGSNNNKNENTSNKNSGDNNNNNNKIFSDDAVRVLGEVRKLFEHLEVDLNVNLTQMSNIRKAYSKIFDICGPINVRVFHSYTYSILAPITYQLLINNQLTLENIGGNFQNVVQHLVAAVDNNHSYLMEWKYKGSVRVPKNEVLFKLINSLKISCEQITAISGMSSLKCRQQYVTSLLNHGVDMECHLVEATKIIICLNVINFFKTHINNKNNDTNDFSVDVINELDNVTNTGDSDGLIFSDVLNNNYHHINNNVNDERDASDRNKFILNDIVKCHESYSSPELIFKNLINCIQDGYHVDDNGLSLISCLLNIKLQVMKPHKYKSDNDDDNTGDDTFVSTYPHHVAKKDKFVSSVSSLSSSLSPSSSSPRKIMIIEDKPGCLYCLPVDEDE